MKQAKSAAKGTKAGTSVSSAASKSKSTSASKSSGQPTVTNWMSKPKPTNNQSAANATVPAGLKVLKAGRSHKELLQGLAKGIPSDKRRAMIVYCVNDKGELAPEMAKISDPRWMQHSQELWRRHTEEGEGEGLGEIQMDKIKQRAGESQLAEKLWLTNAITHESNPSSASLGDLNPKAFDSAMGMVATLAKVKKAAVLLIAVTKQKTSERGEIMKIIDEQLLKKKLQVTLLEVDEERKTAGGFDDEANSGSETEDLDDDGLEQLLVSKGKGSLAKKDDAKPQPIAKTTKEEEEDNSDTEDMDLEEKPAARAVQNDDDSDTEEMDAKDLRPPLPTSSSSSHVPSAKGSQKKVFEQDSSGTEEMEMEEKPFVSTKPGNKRKRSDGEESTNKQPTKKAPVILTEEARKRKDEQRIKRLMQGVGVVFARPDDSEERQMLNDTIEAMGGTVSAVLLIPYISIISI